MFQRLALLALRCTALSSTLSLAASAAPDAPAQAPARAVEPGAPSPEGSLLALARDLELVVTETGPDMPWTLHLRNRGSVPIGLMADPGLLWFEVAVPGTTVPQVCRLPEPLWPKGMRRRAELRLPPGERFSRRFDPRFFCFSDLVQTALVPGSRVTPHFGWPRREQPSVAKGKRVAQPARTAKGPFVAWLLPSTPATASPPDDAPALEAAPGSEGEEDDAEPTPDPPWQAPSEGLENIAGPAIVLSPAYGRWSDRAPAPREGIQVAMLAGSDAEDERSALVTVGLGNAGPVPRLVVVRRELISFSVNGPDGSFECPTGDMGVPDVESFTPLEVGASERLVIRLIEMCPPGGFSRPGLYEVRATLHGKFSGQALGLDAFVGKATSPRPALVRVRSGERSSFLRPALVVPAGEAGGRPAAGAAAPPADAPPAEAPPADEAPGDREGAPAPDDGAPNPEPAPAPEGTSVE